MCCVCTTQILKQPVLELPAPARTTQQPSSLTATLSPSSTTSTRRTPRRSSRTHQGDADGLNAQEILESKDQNQKKPCFILLSGSELFTLMRSVHLSFIQSVGLSGGKFYFLSPTYRSTCLSNLSSIIRDKKRKKRRERREKRRKLREKRRGTTKVFF